MIKKVVFKLLKIYFLTFIFVGCSLRSMADDCVSIDPADCHQDPDDGEEIPLDSGVVFLIISGMTFSIIALRKKKMEANSENV